MSADGLSTRMRRLFEKERLRDQRDRNHHENNRNRTTTFEFDKQGVGHKVEYVATHEGTVKIVWSHKEVANATKQRETQND
ncbi:Uncharacterised protein [uncultured archaeon]|nr:Uncharacterised protein [uncultured archaeon]